MKKLALITLALSCAAGAFAQGTISFNNRVVGSVVTHVYAPLAASPTTHRIGNGTGDTAAGTTDWTGYTLLTGGTFFAQLLGAPGSNVPESGLVPSAGVTTFRTGGAAGWIQPTTSTLGNVQPDAAAATVEMVTWDNSSGLYSTWSQASVAWLGGLIAAGVSGPLNIGPVGGTGTPPNLVGLQSFNLYTIPEPTSFALAGLGAAALMIFRRRK